ncbi:MAG TPA: DUF4386 domain-containing protein, partial [Candidatus Limnocylindria bacterium]|nr:DUF4386 domain-containing protein [Candidatus Limnocylindria bacterium]
MSTELLAGLLLIVTPAAFNVIFIALGRTFDYPDILRRPTDEILRRFVAGGRRLILLWYAFALTGVLFLPLALIIGDLVANDPLGRASVPFGLIAGIVQLVGLLRWSFLVPHLARAYVAPATTGASRDATAVTFESAHRFLGMGIGEHLGYLFTGVWSVLVALALSGSGLVPGVLALVGLVPTAAILIGLLEPAGVRQAGAINAIGYLVWSVWLIALGIALV